MRSSEARTSSTGESFRDLSSGASSVTGRNSRSAESMVWSYRIVDIEIADGLQCFQPALEHRLEHAQPLVADLDAVHCGGMTQNVQRQFGLGALCCSGEQARQCERLK